MTTITKPIVLWSKFPTCMSLAIAEGWQAEKTNKLKIISNKSRYMYTPAKDGECVDASSSLSDFHRDRPTPKGC